MNWQYTARLVPLNVQISIATEPDGTPWHYTFSHETFADEKRSKRVIPICDHHQRHKEIGNIDRLIAQCGWWEAEFTLDPDQPELERGTPVSIGLYCGPTPFLREVSIVPRGAIEGAVVRNRRALLSTETTQPAARTTEANTPARVEVIHDGGAIIRRNIGQVLGVR